ncbi:Nucleotide-binding universal stress protein, UspA family [Nitrosomonas cryotolerans]|uniref:Nucleotide-binding universal stress protein, UspA family n=1 Tax=Nitrosomonas cryotolerans ATCC 49181 TaxID=1131553 RepID=A0A1N6JG84_9PROT|nr:universal stress protein [Nitrosomonas cryotolerans]SFP67171.1 Nucleotide-binding universal stress protein, UspA family [Nitrosomonas cryotolerans]SIO43203.1 Nucleotide-binding universal stress protein, UspA family [Nitrosomonas cryotolerans ATCC 49181]
MYFKNVLVTTDFSDVSFAAFAYAANMEHSHITILNVMQDWNAPPLLLEQLPDPDTLTKYREDIFKQTKAKLDLIAQEHFHNLKTHTEAIPGTDDPAAAICQFANENDINAILIAGHGRGSLGNLFIGSTVQKILQAARCPVIVVPKAR